MTRISRRPIPTRASIRKAVGREAKLGYLGHCSPRIATGLIVDTAVTAATGTAERDAAIVMLGELPLTTRRVTVGADKRYDTRAWVAAVRTMRITPHVAQNDAGDRRQRDRRRARRDTPATRSANASGNGSSKPSAG